MPGIGPAHGRRRSWRRSPTRRRDPQDCRHRDRRRRRCADRYRDRRDRRGATDARTPHRSRPSWSSSPACPAPAAAPRPRSWRTSAGSSSTTCRRRCCATSCGSSTTSRGREPADRGRRRRPRRARSSTTCRPTSHQRRDRPARRRCCSSRPPTTCWSAATRPSAARTRCRASGRLLDGIAARARAAGRPARRRRRRHRHHRPQRARAHATGSPTRSARPTTTAAAGHRGRFGFKYGIPVDADFVVDMRFLPNPHWVPELRAADRPRRRRSPTTCSASPGADEFLDRYVAAARDRRRGLPRARASAT